LISCISCDGPLEKRPPQMLDFVGSLSGEVSLLDMSLSVMA
jgi:hypothetical protein